MSLMITTSSIIIIKRYIFQKNTSLFSYIDNKDNSTYHYFHLDTQLMDIKNSPSGKIVQTMTGYQAFLPNPLPPAIRWNLRLINALSRADQVIGKLAGEGKKLPNPHLLLRPFITREA